MQWGTFAARRGDWLFMAGLYAIALGTRLTFLNSHPWLDEAAYFYVSQTGGYAIPNYYRGDEPTLWSGDLRWLFWQRPLFAVILAPGALLGFTGFRLNYVLLAALVAPVAFGLLRAHQVRRSLAAAAGLVAALHPLFVVFGSRAMSDTPMVLALGIALWARGANRPIVYGAALVAAGWFKEAAAIPTAALLFASLWAGWRAGEVRPWPLRMDVWSTASAYGLFLGLAPLAYTMYDGGPLPGWQRGGDPLEIADRMFLLLWFAPLVVAGLVHRRTRVVAAAALGFPAFYAYYRFEGRGLGPNHYVGTAFLALVAAAFVLDEWWTRTRTSPVRAARPAAPSLAVALGLLLAGAMVLPQTSSLKADLTMPLSNLHEPSLEEWKDAELARDQTVFDVANWLRDHRPGVLVILDVDWFWHFYPFAYAADEIRGANTWFVEVLGYTPQQVSRLVEETGDATLVGKYPGAGNVALREVYADCITYDNPFFVVIAGKGCPGRADAYAAARQDHAAAEASG